jgi:hypothetical protein
MPKGREPRGLSPAILAAAERFREQVRKTAGGVEASAARLEELMSRSSQENATFLGGSLLPVLNYALLNQAREETLQSAAKIEKSDPADAIDHTDFFASALGEMAALIKILATMELESGSALREDWEKLADDLQALASALQRAVEKFEDELEANEPPQGPLIRIQ